MAQHVCPWWGGYFIDNRLRRLLHTPEKILAPYLQPGLKVMDFGCGMGFFSIPMARLVGNTGQVIAADLQPQMLEVLYKRAERAGVADRIHKHKCQSDSIGYDGQVDFVLAFWSAHETPDTGALVREIHGCLVDGGRLLIVEPWGHVSASALAEMVDQAQQAGLSFQDAPSIRLSRTALLVKSSSAAS